MSGAVPIAQIVLTFTHPTNATAALTFTIDTTTPNGEWPLSIPSATASGPYRLTSILTTDRDGLSISYRGEGTAIESLDGFSYVFASDLVYLDNTSLSLTVEGGSTSSPPLGLSAWEREVTDELAPGNTLRFTFATEASAFPVQRASIRITGPFGMTRTLNVDAAAGTFTLPVTSDWINGSCSVTVITLTDSVGRRLSYLPAGGSIFVGGRTITGSPFPRERFTFRVRGARDAGPYFIVQPAPNTTLRADQDYVTLNAFAVGLGTINYQWYRGEVGDTSQPLAGDAVRPSQLGASVTSPTTFWVRATAGGRTADSQPARVVPRPRDFGRLTNLSILTELTSTSDNFTLGYVAGGSSASGNKQILVRAAGPSLGALGVSNALADPKLQLYRGNTLVSENDNWNGSTSLSAAMTGVGAFPFVSSTSRDAAALTPVTAGANHSVKVSGTGSGMVIAELYDAGPNPTEILTAPRLLNISVLKELGAGLTVGFSIAGSSPVNILVRAVGPALTESPFNIASAVRDPRLILYRGSTRIAVSDNWDSSGSALDSAFLRVGAFRLSSSSKDAALLAELSPGSYTAQIKATGSGMVLVEVYEVP